MNENREKELLFCIVPAFNEEANVKNTVLKLTRYVENIIVVDDGSTDNTYVVLRQLRKEIGGLVVLRHSINRGQGAALETGNEFARRHGADLVVHFDADGQFNPEEIERVVGPIRSGEADIVFGSRFIDGLSNTPFFKKFIFLPIGRIVNYLLVGGNLKDPQNGFRAMSKKALNLVRIENDGMAHCTEIIGKSIKLNLKIKEVPVTVTYSRFGQGLKGGVKIVKDLLLEKFI